MPEEHGFESHTEINIALSSNGRTLDFDSRCVGSNPAGATMSKRYSGRLAAFFKKVVVVKNPRP